MITLKEISEYLQMPFEGDGTILISGPAEPKFASKTHLALATEKKYFEDVKSSDARVALFVEGTSWNGIGLEGALFVKRSRYAMAQINQLFDEPLSELNGVHPSAIVSDTAVIGHGVSVGPFSFIGDKVEIKENSTISSHVVIGKNSLIGKDALVHSGVRIGAKVVIGDRFICHSNSVIGSDGFSFVSPETGGVEQAKRTGTMKDVTQISAYVRIASLGSVKIGSDVEIGAGSTIDRGTIDDTKIGDGTKLDNMVHVAHNVSIGENCLLCGQVGIAGSAEIGDRVVLAGQVGVADHVSIGNDSIIAAKSGVVSNVAKGRFMMGNPAMKIENNIESYKIFRRLPQILKKIENLQKIVLGK